MRRCHARDKANPSSGEAVLDWRELHALPREKHLRAPLIVLTRNPGHVDTRTVERAHGYLSVSYIAHEIRRPAPRFGTVSEDGPVAELGGVR
jgi:hypothetical protein